MTFQQLVQKAAPSDFSRFQKSCARLGDPQKEFPAIHIAGTNGKGSVAVKCAKILELSGYKVGLYTSPHLFSYSERISISGIPISEEAIEEGLSKLLAWEECVNYFEITTLLALDYFRAQRVDVAVMETGMGGALDATNVVQPLVSVITSISEDHCPILGNTLEEIARQKGGIIKPGAPVVLGPNAQFPALLERAKACGSPLTTIQGTFPFYDDENSAIARAAIQASGLEVTADALEAGLKIRPRCRFEQHGRLIYDVAHNPDGFKRLLDALELHFPGQPFRLYVGFSQDKDIGACLKQCVHRARHIYLMEANTPRRASVKTLAAILDSMDYPNYSMNRTLEEALAESDELLVVAGSVYLFERCARCNPASLGAG